MRVTILKIFLISCLPVVFGIVACTRNTIEFGTVPENTYTNLNFIDTIGTNFSTVLTDSFATGGATSYLLGRYRDPFLGTVTAGPFFQVDKPAVIPDIPPTGTYDSLVLITKLNHYYYGDSTLPQTIIVNELNEPILATYGTNLYNTSSFSVKPTPLGTKTLTIRPLADDSIAIRLNDAKGLALFNKLQSQSTDITSTENFSAYFKGISLSTDLNRLSNMIGLYGGPDSVAMRLYYHTNTPYFVSYSVDFPSLANSFAFNKVSADRSGTGIVSNGSGVTEFQASQTGGYSFSQPGTGLNLKVSFPSLKSVLQLGTYVKLLKAELFIRPAYLSFDNTKFYLPGRLGLSMTNGSNIMGSSLTDSTGAATLYASPIIDQIYGENTYYRFNVTNYITQLLNTAGNDNALYIVPGEGTDGSSITRMVVGGTTHANYISQLQLSVLIVK